MEMIWAIMTGFVIYRLEKEAVAKKNGSKATDHMTVVLDWTGAWITLALILRVLGTPFLGFPGGILLATITYFATMTVAQQNTNAFERTSLDWFLEKARVVGTWTGRHSKKWAGKAWGKIRKRLGLPERLFRTEEENVLRRLEDVLVAQIGDSPLLAPLAADVHRLVHMEAPRLLRALAQNKDAHLRIHALLEATKQEEASPERQRNEAISARMERRILDQEALLKKLRHKLVHLGPVIEDVRANLENGSGSEAQEALRYLEELTSAIHSSVAEEVSSPPSLSSPGGEGDAIVAPPSRTRVS